MTPEYGKLIELIGPTCGGKTTFAKDLGVALGATVFLETTEDNPYMADAHRSGEHSWNNQVWFLQQYVRRLSEATRLLEDGKIAIIDSGFPTYLLHSTIILTPDQNTRYGDLAARLTQHLAIPDLTLYLKDDKDFLMARLKRRNKGHDDADPDFVDTLTRLHNEWVAQTHLPVVSIHSRDLEHEGLKKDIIRTIALTIKPPSVIRASV